MPISNAPDDHEDNEMERRSCLGHDTHMHWVDDIAYTEENTRIPVPDNAPTLRDIAALLSQSIPEGDPKVYRFAVVYVDGETGKLDVFASRDNIYSTINLLTRAASIMAFQEYEQAKHTNDFLRQMLGRAAKAMPTLPDMPELPDGEKEFWGNIL